MKLVLLIALISAVLPLEKEELFREAREAWARMKEEIKSKPIFTAEDAQIKQVNMLTEVPQENIFVTPQTIRKPNNHKQTIYISVMVTVWLIVTLLFAFMFCVCCNKRTAKKNRQI